MKIFCQHNWVEKLKTFQPSEIEVIRKNDGKIYYNTDDYTKSYTTILWECSKCQKLRKEVLEGELLTPNPYEQETN